MTKDQNDQNEVKWNAHPNMEELYFHCYRKRSPLKIEFGQAMPKLTYLALSSIDVEMLSVFSTQSFPLLERLFFKRGYGAPTPDGQVIYNILENCPNLKSIRLASFELSDPNSVSKWHSFLLEIYKVFNAYIDIYRHDDYHQRAPLKMFEDYLEKTDLVTFEKYKKMKADYLDWTKNHTDPSK